MKNRIIFLVFASVIIFNLKLKGQMLSVSQVCEYLEQNIHVRYNDKIKIEVQKDGYFRIKHFEERAKYPKPDLGFHYSDVKSIDIKEDYLYGANAVIINLKKAPDKYEPGSNCLEGRNDHFYIGIGIYCIKDQRQAAKIKNAFSYIFEEIKYNSDYNQNDSDPFSDYNYHRLKNKISSSRTEHKIKLLKENGVYTLPIKLSGITVGKAILDSGASDVTISKNIEDELIRQGKISKSSYLSPALYKIADGSIIQANRFILPEITIDDLKVPNVICSVMVNNSSDILLGQGFLKRFTSWQLDNLTSTLILKP